MKGLDWLRMTLITMKLPHVWLCLIVHTVVRTWLIVIANGAAIGGTEVHAASLGAAEMKASALFPHDVDHDALTSGTLQLVVRGSSYATVAGAADMEGSAMFPLDVDHDAVSTGTV
jgi:hypothetical protein